MPADWMRALCCSVPTEKALGMVTACDVRCVCDVPNYTSALRDGWAVRSADNGQTRTAAAWSVENGRSHEQLQPGQAVWVNTGGNVPQGADAVIASRNSLDLQKIQSCVVPGENIELQGSDWKHGDVLVPAGSRVGAREMALLFEAGVKRVAGWASPRVAVVATGSEITKEAEDLSSGFRRCSNASYIAALMSRIGVKDIRTIVVPDDITELTRTLVELDAVCDVIITVGGTGKGKRDYTRQAVSDAGGVFVGRDTQQDFAIRDSSPAPRWPHRTARQPSGRHDDRAMRSSGKRTFGLSPSRSPVTNRRSHPQRGHRSRHSRRTVRQCQRQYGVSACQRHRPHASFRSGTRLCSPQRSRTQEGRLRDGRTLSQLRKRLYSVRLLK